jgi:hypothetical protein
MVAVLVCFAVAVGIAYAYDLAYWRGFSEGLRWTHVNIERRLGVAAMRRFRELAREELSDAKKDG